MQTNSSMSPPRPILTSLNGDNSWLFSLPRPTDEQAATGRIFYHIVFEPWLNGPVTQFTTWMIHFYREETPSALTQAHIEDLIEDIERKAGNTAKPQSTGDKSKKGSIDAILLGFHYGDHVHEPTLKLFSPDIPVIATPEAAALVSRMSHFNSITTFSDATTESVKSWQTTSTGSLPTWLHLVRFAGHHELNYCLAIIWTHVEDGTEQHEMILQSPHGLRELPQPLIDFLAAEPRKKPLAMMHGLKESYALGFINTFGAKSGLRLYRAAPEAKYWIHSHDTMLTYAGTLMRLIGVHDVQRSLEWALDEEADKSQTSKPHLVDVGNGGQLVLA